MARKRPFNEGKRQFKKNKRQKEAPGKEDASQEPLLADVRRMLKSVRISQEDQKEQDCPPEQSDVELTISDISSTGDGLAEKDGRIYVIPFTAPGDTVRARVYKNFFDDPFSLGYSAQLLSPASERIKPQCKYFAQCSGCQFQHLPYDFQLAHKRKIVERAYENFSNLPASAIPDVRDTVASPLHYGYRTKLTPHFDGPRGQRGARRRGEKVVWPDVPPIGFMFKGTRRTLDIEDCPIGTDAVRLGMKRERKRVAENINKYQKGATLLLRENTQRVEKKDEAAEGAKGEGEDVELVDEDRGQYIHRKTCITDSKATSTEYIDDFRLDNPAGAFFQNNNSILPLVTQYIRENILGPDSADLHRPQIKNLIDAYCGSGFFTITLSGMFSTSIGIDISGQSIEFASQNAKLNNLPLESTRFIAADANDLFSAVDKEKFAPTETAVVIDPPRKGCDQGFIKQLLKYAPARICYVSCNVHTQARDVGWLVQGFDGEAGLYAIESLRGFDFFPQTSHVEGVAILRKKSAAAAGMEMYPC